MPETNSTPSPVPTIGQQVRVLSLPPYLKTADPMPMLRPPSAIAVGEVGIVLARRPGNSWSLRFASGAYLLDRNHFEPIDVEESKASESDPGTAPPTDDAAQ